MINITVPPKMDYKWQLKKSETQTNVSHHSKELGAPLKTNTKSVCGWYKLVVPALRRLRTGKVKVQGQQGLHSQFTPSLSYLARLSLAR